MTQEPDDKQIDARKAYVLTDVEQKHFKDLQQQRMNILSQIAKGQSQAGQIEAATRGGLVLILRQQQLEGDYVLDIEGGFLRPKANAQEVKKDA